MEKILAGRIPDGMILVKKGGRPKADARNIAVLMTRQWRTKILKERVKQADAWILDHWSSRNGMTEESSIRRAIRAAKGGPLNGYEIDRLPNSYEPLTGKCFFDGPVTFEAYKYPLMNGAIVWVWREGMKNAGQYIVDNPQVEFVIVDEIKQLTDEERKRVPARRKFPPRPCLGDRK